MRTFLSFICLCVGISITGDAGARDFLEIQEKGFIEIAVYESFPPFSYKSQDGKITGIDVDLGRAIADKLGVTAVFRFFPADESVEDDLRNVIWKGHYMGGGVADMMLHAPFDPGFARQVDQVVFISPYYQEEVAFIIDPGQLKNVNTLEIFTRNKIGVETATLSDDYLLQAFARRIRDNVVHYRNLMEAAAALEQREITAIMGNRSELEFGILSTSLHFPVTKLPTPGLSVAGWNLGAAVDADNVELAGELNRIIDSLTADGTVATIFAGHGVTYSLPRPVNIRSASAQE